MKSAYINAKSILYFMVIAQVGHVNNFIHYTRFTQWIKPSSHEGCMKELTREITSDLISVHFVLAHLWEEDLEL